MAIDAMKSWIGMGDRDQYQPLMLINAIIPQNPR